MNTRQLAFTLTGLLALVFVAPGAAADRLLGVSGSKIETATATAPSAGVPRFSKSWRSFVRGSRSRLVPPHNVHATIGLVTRAKGVLKPGGGASRLTVPGEGESALVLDFGEEIVGRLEILVARASDPPPRVRVAFSETLAHLGSVSDFSHLTATDDHVPNPAGGVWRDRRGCQTDDICADGVRAFRYARISVESRGGSSGYVDIDHVRLRQTPPLARRNRYRGWFLSSDDLLNRIWYASVRTLELATDRFTSESVDTRGCRSEALAEKVVILDGAKRDRCPYSGDVAVAGRTLMVSHADRQPIVSILTALAELQHADGYIPPSPAQSGSLRLVDYPAWWVLTLHDYVLYSGDVALVRRLWPNLVGLLDRWFLSKTDGDGLFVTPGGFLDYGFIPRGGRRVTYYNANYVRALRAAAELGTLLGRSTKARTWRARARRTAAAVNAQLWDGKVGAFRDATAGLTVHTQDGNAFAVLAGIPTPRRADTALGYLARALRRPWGNAVADANVWGLWWEQATERVSPFMSYFEVLARFTANRDVKALEQLRRTWGWMIAPERDAPGTMWEAIGPQGSSDAFLNGPGAFSSLAHGWSTGAAPALTNELLGVKPTSSGFSTYDAVPHPGDVSWAQGRIWTPRGPIRFAWRQLRRGGFRARLIAPRGTVGRVGVPTFSRDVSVRINGALAWDGVPRAHAARTDGRYVYLQLRGGREYEITSDAAGSTG